MRLFIAALLPDDVRQSLGEFTNSIKPNIEGVKWEKREKLHVTLKFLGETEEKLANEISEIVGGLAQKYSPFSLSVTNIGGFPGLDNPRVLYIGLSPNEELSAFQREIESSLEPLGFAKESRRFVPHVTIGRVRKRFAIKAPVPLPEKVKFEISSIGVIKSDLKPGGSLYTPLKLFELTD